MSFGQSNVVRQPKTSRPVGSESISPIQTQATALRPPSSNSNAIEQHRTNTAVTRDAGRNGQTGAISLGAPVSQNSRFTQATIAQESAAQSHNRFGAFPPTSGNIGTEKTPYHMVSDLQLNPSDGGLPGRPYAQSVPGSAGKFAGAPVFFSGNQNSSESRLATLLPHSSV